MPAATPESQLDPEPPPSGVQALIAFGGAFVGPADIVPCPGDNPDAQVLTRPESSEPIPISSNIAIYFCQFVPSQDIAVQIRQPDGRMLDLGTRARDDGTGRLEWWSLPGEPLGVYTVTARQGPRQASTSFTIRAASAPRVQVFPERGPPGTTFEIGLAGFPPRQGVLLRVYRAFGSDSYLYTTTLGVVTMDQQGQARHTVRTQRRDIIDEYVVVAEPSAGRPPSFWLVPPDSR